MKVNRIVSVFMLAGIMLTSFRLYAQEKYLWTEDDGFQWYKVTNGNYFGAESIDGTTLIPLSRGYEMLTYIVDRNGGWFSVMKKGSCGICNKNGREIVSPGRYDFACYMDDGFILTELDFEYGVCDKSGNEIIAPKYEGRVVYKDGVFKYESESGNYISTGYSLFDFYFPVYFDFQSDKYILADEDNLCSFYIVRFELKPYQIVVKVINSDGRANSEETIIETHYINPSDSQLELWSNTHFNLHFKYAGVDRAIQIRHDKYDAINIAYDIKNRDTNSHSFKQHSIISELKEKTKDVFCPGYLIENNYGTKYEALLKTVKNYSWKHVTRD